MNALKIILLLSTMVYPTDFTTTYRDCDNYESLGGSIDEWGYKFRYESCKCNETKNDSRKYVINNDNNISMPFVWKDKNEVFVEGKIGRKGNAVAIRSGSVVSQGYSIMGFGINADEVVKKQVPTFVGDMSTYDRGQLPTPDSSRWSWKPFELLYPRQETKLVGHFSIDDTSSTYINLYLYSDATQDSSNSNFNLRYWVDAKECGPFRILRPSEEISRQLVIKWGLLYNQTYFSFLRIDKSHSDMILSPERSNEGFSLTATAKEISLLHNIPLEVFYAGEKLVSYSTSLYVPIR